MRKKNIILLFFCRSCEQGCHLLALFLWHALLIILLVTWVVGTCSNRVKPPLTCQKKTGNLCYSFSVSNQPISDIGCTFQTQCIKRVPPPAWIYIYKSWSFIKFIKDPYLIKLKNVNKRVVHCRFHHFVFANIRVVL